MRAVMLVMFFVSSFAFAIEQDQQEERFEESKQQAHDARVGYCAAYQMLSGNFDAVDKVQQMAVDRFLMARSAHALARHLQKSERDKRNAMMVGKTACDELKFVPEKDSSKK